MNILKKFLPDSWFNAMDSKENNSEKENISNGKGWLASIHRFNENVGHLVSFNSKLLLFIMLVFFVYLLFATIFQEESFSIHQLNVHSSLESKGYNSGFVAKKISYNIASLVNEVPEKLLAMFSSEDGDEKKEILYSRILDKYLKKEIKVDFNVDVGGVTLPIRDLTKIARGLFDVEDKSLDGDITVEDNMIIMTLGFSSGGVNKTNETKRYSYIPTDSIKLIDVIDSLTLDAAKFVLKQYDPIVTLLIDFNPTVVYSSRDQKWGGTSTNEGDITNLEEERLVILKKMYLNDKKDKELAIWAHAIAGTIYADKFGRHSELQKYNSFAIKHFEKAIEMDASFVDILGIDLANRYSDVEDSASFNKVITIYQKMIQSAPSNLEIYDKLFAIYSDKNKKNEYLKLLESAFRNRLYITESNLEMSQYAKFKDQNEFKLLVKKYNENNKPVF